LRQPAATKIRGRDASLDVASESIAAASARTDARERALYLVGLGVVLLLGLSVRLVMLGHSGFPINDGGMFDAAVAQIQAAHFHLPSELHYNGLSIPFAYPPLGFYVAAAVSSATGASILHLLRILPLIFSLATIVAFMAFANEYLRNRAAVVAASLAFALVPRSYNWEIMGGGLTRGLAYFFAILALWQGYRLFTRRSASSLAMTALFGALTCLSHIEVAWFVAFSLAFFYVTLNRSRAGLRDSVLVGAGVLLLTSPWWITVVTRDGLTPFQNAGQSGADALSNILALVFIFNWGDEPRFPLFGALAALGIIVSLRRGKSFLPLWVLIILILDTRKFQTDAMIPLALLVGAVITQFLMPLVSDAGSRWLSTSDDEAAPAHTRSRSARWLGPITVALILGYGWLSSLGASQGSYTALSTSERDAMAWVRQSTPNSAIFAVVTGDSWALDRSSEWFPVLADRVSVATVQGYEWVPDNGYSRQQDAYIALQKCSTETPQCLTEWSNEYGKSYDYVYVAHREVQRAVVDYHAPCCAGLDGLLSASPDYKLVFQNDDATIFQHVTAMTNADDGANLAAQRQIRP
jgi:hypothetical protein